MLISFLLQDSIPKPRFKSRFGTITHHAKSPFSVKNTSRKGGGAAATSLNHRVMLGEVQSTVAAV